MVQVNPTKLFVRFRFKKQGSLQYISHLDLVRTMHKVIVRAKLPLWYTEGFNPKPKMIFAAPLSIGTESVCEFMDLRMNEYIDPAEAMARINDNMTDEMQIVEAYYPESKFTDLKWMSYRITIRTLGQIDELVDSCNALLSAPVIEVQKKNSEKTADIRPLIKSASAVKDGDAIVINALLSADPSAFLNPEYVIKALRDGVGILSSDDLTAESYEIMRLNAYFADMSEFR
jgi:radical SAM-linked protein